MTHAHDENTNNKSEDASRLRSNLSQLFALSWPSILLYLIQTLIPMSTTYFIGHLGSVPLAAAALGNMICNTSGMSIGVGITQALDTFCTQAFGAKQYKLVGLHCQRAMAISTVACVPIIIIWCFTEPILNLVGVEPEVSRMAGVWTIWLIPGLWPNLQFECFKRYLISQSITWPQTASVILVAGLHGFFCWLVIRHLDVGFLGAPMMVSISNWLMLIFALIFTHVNNRFFPKQKEYITDFTPSPSISISSDSSSSISDVDAGEESIQIVQMKNLVSPLHTQDADIHYEASLREIDPNDTWPALSMQIFTGWGKFLEIGIPAAKWGSWEVNAFFVAHFGSKSLASHAIAANLTGLWYMPALGLSSALTTLIGNSLGQNRPDNAKSFAQIGLLATFIFSVINGGLGLAYRNVIGGVFSDDAEVCAVVGTIMFILWPYHVADLQKCVGTAILRGCGRPKVTMVGNLISTLVVGYPLAYVLGWIADLKILGIWVSMTIAWVTAMVIYLVFVLRMDWENEMILAMGRIHESQQLQHKLEALEKQQEEEELSVSTCDVK